jgi:hypothetical protein
MGRKTMMQGVQGTSNIAVRANGSVLESSKMVAETGRVKKEAVRTILNIPDDKYVCGIITLGYGDETPGQRPRKKLEDMVRYEKW